MPNLELWNWILLGVGGAIAVATLVSLMRRRRDEVLSELTAEAKEQQRQQKAAARQKSDRRPRSGAR